MQYSYSLVNRDIEDEHVPLAKEIGSGIVPWSPLAFGFLTGKYDRTKVEASSPRASGLPNEAAKSGEKRSEEEKRLDGANPFGDSLFTDRNWKIVDELKRVAAEVGQSSARVALAWVSGRSGVASILIGVSRPEQVEHNFAALDLQLTQEQRAALDAISSPSEPRMLYSLLTPPVRKNVVFGGTPVSTLP